MSFDLQAETELSKLNGKADTTRMMRVDDIKPFADYEHKEPSWIVEGFIPAGSVIVVWGETGSGKSTFIHALCMAVANGTPFLGRDTKQSPVLILDRENSAHSLGREFERIGFHDGENLRYWGGWCGQEAPALGSAAILEWVKVHPDCLIIIDSYVAFFDGESENDAVGTRRFIGQARTLTTAGATVVYLHHPGKDPDKGPRGSSDIRPGIDFEYRFSNYDTAGRGFLDRITIKSDKTRFEPVSLNVQYVNGQFTIDGVTRSKTVTERLAELLEANPGCSTTEFRELANDRGLGRNRACGFLDSGIRNGSVKVEQTGRRKSYFYNRPPGDFQIMSGRYISDRAIDGEYEQ